MNRKTLIGFGLVLAVLAICSFVASNAVVAQTKPEAKPEAKKPEPPKAEPKKDEPKKDEPKKDEPKKDAAKEVTLTGKLTDLHCYMVGAPKEDAAKCAADCIKAGVPAVLETPTGIVFICKGAKGGAEFSAMALQDVEVKGKLYEKGGLKYVDVTAIAKKGGEAKKEEPKKEEPKKAEPPKAEVKKAEPPKDVKKEEPKKEEPKKQDPPKK